MKDWKLRMASGLLALGLVCAAPAPAMARTPEHPAGGWVSGLMDLPVVGDLLRLLTGGGEEAAAGEGASTAETAATAETATAESAETAARAAPAEAAAPQPWPQSWMQGAVQPGVELPRADADDPALPDALTATQWAALPVGQDILSLTSREETNFGDLTADAAAQAAAAWLWQQGEATADLRSLPVAAAIPGELLTRSAAAGTALADLGGCLAEGDLSLAMVQITPARLVSVLETGLADREDPTGEGYGLFLQLSGLRMTYTEEGTARVAELALADPEEEAGRALALDDEQTPLLLVLPRACLETFGLTEAEGCPDLLADAGLTLPDALAALPANLGAADTAALLDRTAPAGRVLPADAADAAFTGVVELGADYAGRQIRLLVDGREVTAVTDAQGRLTLPGLAGGGHTLQMAAGEPAYYLSDRTGVGTGAEGSVPVTVTAVPADCVLGPAATATPAPTAAPTAAPVTVTVTSPEEEPATPAPTAAPTPVPAATAAPTARPTAAPIFDPTAEMLQATPDPTLAPTATPAPTAEPTPDPARLEEQEAARKTSSQLPLYIGLGLAAVGAAAVAVVLVRRKLTARSGHTYRRKP